LNKSTGILNDHCGILLQLLRSLFGQKQAAVVATTAAAAEAGVGLYEGCFARHYRRLFSGLEAARAVAPAAATAGGRVAEKRAHRDKAALASYIKLFEPVVIKALEVCFFHYLLYILNRNV
jgi:hypothetical protein